MTNPPPTPHPPPPPQKKTQKKTQLLQIYLQYHQIQLGIHTDLIMAAKCMTYLKEDTKLISALLAISPNSAWHSHGSLSH